MIDPNLTLLTWFQSSAALTALIGTNIYSPELPEGFSAMASSAPNSATRALVFKTRGGKPEAEIPEVIDPSFAIECWAMEATDAKKIYGLVRDMLHGACGIDLGDAGYVILCQEEVFGQDVIDPATKWAFVVAYYHLKLRSSTTTPSPVTPVQFIGADMPSKSFPWIAQGGLDTFGHLKDSRQVKSSPGTVTSISTFSPPTGQSAVYLKLFDKATAPDPTSGDEPLITVGVEEGLRADPQLPYGGKEFVNGIWMMITKFMAVDDVTPVSAGDVSVDIGFQ